MGCDPEEEEDGEPDVEAFRFRDRVWAEVSPSEQESDRQSDRQSDRRSDVCGARFWIRMWRDKSHM